MKFKTKKEALASFVVRQRTVGGVVYPLYSVYLGTNLVTGKQERLAASSKIKLTKMVEDFYKAREASGDFASSMTPEEIVDARAAKRILAEAGLDISLTECAKREATRSGIAKNYTVTAGKAFDAFMETKELNSELEIKKTESTTGRWVFAFGRDRKISEANAQDVLSYLKTNYGSSKPRTYNAHLSYLRTFFNWCCAKTQGYMPDNPAADIGLKPIEWTEPKFLSTEECRELLYALWEHKDEHPEYLALTVNGLLMGIRREESLRMASDPTAISVNLEDETVRIGKPKGYTKGIMPRAFHMTKMAAVWAKSFDYAKGVSLICDRTSSDIANFAKSLGIEIPQNGYRHTFITKHVAAYGEPEKTQAMVGTSAQMRANNYCGLDSKKEGLAFFEIMPPKE